MKAKGKYLVLIILGFSLNNSYSMATDSIACDTGMISIQFNCIPSINGRELLRGDIISMGTSAEAMIEGGTLIYNPDTINSMDIYYPSADFETAQTNLSFSVISQEYGCTSGNVQFVLDSTFESNCQLNIIFFNALFHTLEYSSYDICYTAEPLLPVTTLPANNFTVFSNSEGIEVAANGEIRAKNSVPGVYLLSIETDFCLLPDSLIISIVAPPQLNIGEVAQVCPGTSFEEFNLNYPDIVAYSDRDENLPLASEIIQSGNYILSSADSLCPAIDTLYIEVLPRSEVEWNIVQECDHVRLETSASDPGLEAVISDAGGSSSNLIYEDKEVFITVMDSYGCRTVDSIWVEVKNMELVSAEYFKQEADCWEDGKLIIEGEVLNNYVGEYQYQLKNALTNQLITNLEEIPEGVYNLQAVDDRQCIASLEDQITVLQKCLEDYPVFSPQGERDESYFIPHIGMVNIYNREGQLVRELETPAYWDGTSGSGEILPMGNYLMITDTDRKVNITIVR